jgi:hypothetical protein
LASDKEQVASGKNLRNRGQGFKGPRGQANPIIILGDVDEIVNFEKQAQEPEPGFFPCALATY